MGSYVCTTRPFRNGPHGTDYEIKVKLLSKHRQLSSPLRKGVDRRKRCFEWTGSRCQVDPDSDEIRELVLARLKSTW